MDLFAHEVELVLWYLGFLISFNDHNVCLSFFLFGIGILTQKLF